VRVQRAPERHCRRSRGQGIPALHLGSLFERPEIKDLLALLSLVTDPRAAAMVRVATMTRHQMPLQDVMRVIEHLRAANPASLAWAAMHAEVDGLADGSREAIARCPRSLQA
jgi:superfamily I DNA/RNA helicase